MRRKTGVKRDKTQANMVEYICDYNFIKFDRDYYFEYYMETIFQKLDSYKLFENHEIISDMFNIEKFNLVWNTNTFLTISLMDLYALPRLLYNYKNTKLKILSAGAYHCSLYSEFITTFYGKPQNYSKYSSMNILEKEKEKDNEKEELSRCILIN